jgi:hypothetical protein
MLPKAVTRYIVDSDEEEEQLMADAGYGESDGRSASGGPILMRAWREVSFLFILIVELYLL